MGLTPSPPSEIFGIFNSFEGFPKRIIIPNFLDKQFENLNIPLNRKPIIMWCVTRDRGLNIVINLWKRFNHERIELIPTASLLQGVACRMDALHAGRIGGMQMPAA